jgi:16S rRNA pseudouridine516 synthase
MLNGEHKVCRPALLSFESATAACVEVSEGRYHQVRRMFAVFGCHVEALHREIFGQWELGSLTEGNFQILTL